MNLFIRTKSGIQLIDGYKLQNDLACHHALAHNDTGWVVVDKASGLMIKNNFKTLKDCMNYAANCPELPRILEIRKLAKYQDAVKMIAD